MTCHKCGHVFVVGDFPFCTPTSGHRGGTTRINGDECDYIDHNLGPEPIRITSWSQRRAIMAARGLEEMIRYVPPPEGSAVNPQAPSNWGAYRDLRPETLKWIADRMCSGKPAKEEPNPDHQIQTFIPINEAAY